MFGLTASRQLCAGVVCQNNGNCTEDLVAQTYKCICMPKFTGRHCELGTHYCLFYTLLYIDIQFIRRVSKNCAKLFFWRNIVILPPTVKSFGTKMAKGINLCEVRSFSTSPNLCQRTTVLNADVSNCYITLLIDYVSHNVTLTNRSKILSDADFLIHMLYKYLY